MLLDMQTYLPDEILVKTDRASMKYSMEVRCPLLDHRIMEQSFRIPHTFKYHGFDKKHILKDVTYKYVPKELLDRPKKGFGVPLRKWLRAVLKEFLPAMVPGIYRRFVEQWMNEVKESFFERICVWEDYILQLIPRWMPVSIG